MKEPIIEDRFHRLFRGRVDVKGTWEGGAVKKAVNNNDYHRHLHSNNPEDWMGVYPLAADRCTWGCIDIDGKDHRLVLDTSAGTVDTGWNWAEMADLAFNICQLLRVKDVHAHTETTANGIHIWVFPEDTSVDAKIMRRTLMAACTAIDYKPKEVNPKQETLAHGQVGNYVRLPYYGALNPENEGAWQKDRYFFDWDDPDGCHPHTVAQHSLRSFLDTVKLTSTAALEECAKLWTPPVVKHAVDPTLGLDAEQMVRGLNGLGYTIWRDGPLPGNDRSSTLAHLAHLCAESALTQQQAYSIIVSADLRWGKFYDRNDGVDQMTAIVERAYAT